MSIGDRTRVEILERLRLTESQLVVTTQRLEAVERKLAAARLGIENIAAQARLCMDHVGIPEHQKQWVRNEITNEERIALAHIEQPQEVESKNSRVLASFVGYCQEHPHERFWQALRNWAGLAFVFASSTGHDYQDTFYWEGKDRQIEQPQSTPAGKTGEP